MNEGHVVLAVIGNNGNDNDDSVELIGFLCDNSIYAFQIFILVCKVSTFPLNYCF